MEFLSFIHVLEKKYLIIFPICKVRELNEFRKASIPVHLYLARSQDPEENSGGTFLCFTSCHLYLIHLRLGLSVIKGL